MSDTSRPRAVRIGPLPRLVDQTMESDHGAPLLDEVVDAAGLEVAAVGGFTRVGAAEMDRLPDLRAIANYGVGYDNIDVAEAGRRGVAVANTPGVLDDATADVAVVLVLDVVRGISAADRFVRRGAWAAGEKVVLTRDLRGKRVGILGLGRIGTAVATRLEVFGTTIGYHSRSPKDVEWTYHDSPVALAEASDVLVVLTPGGPATAGLIGPEVLDALGPEGYLVNVARGSVVDEDALVAALQGGRIAGAGLDVYADEPHVPEALLAREDVVLLPHVGSATVETRRAMGQLVLDNVAAYLEHGGLVTPV